MNPPCPNIGVEEWIAVVGPDRVGDEGGSSLAAGVRKGVMPRGVQLPSFVEVGVVAVWWSLEGDWRGVWILVGDGEGVGVVGRREGEGEAGDSGRRNGEVRGEPKERGDGL